MGRLPPTHVDDPVAMGRRIRSARTAAGLSLRALAFPGCSPSFLVRVEAGERVPSARVIAELARRLDLPYEQLSGRRISVGGLPEGEIEAVELAVRLDHETAEQDAEALLERARAMQDGHAASRALEALGHAALRRRDDDRAIELFGQARDEGGSSTGPRVRPALHQGLGRALAGSGDLVRAAAVLEEALDDAIAEPADPVLIAAFGSFLAYALTDAGRFEDAEAVLVRLLEHEREMRDPLSLVRLDFALARTYAEEGRTQLAERYSRRLLARLDRSDEDETLGRAHLLLAEILLDRDDPDAAEAHLDRAGALMGPAVAGPEIAMVSVERARAHLQRGQLEEAESLARRALDETEATEPGIAGAAIAVLARVRLAEGDAAEAAILCREAIEHLRDRAAPHHLRETYELLSQAEEDAGNLHAALSAARQASSLRTPAERIAD